MAPDGWAQFFEVPLVIERQSRLAADPIEKTVIVWGVRMRLLISVVALLSLLSALSFTFICVAQEASACVVLGTENIRFQRAARQSDPEYHSIETASYKHVRFYLKAGHGVARLEAVIRGKLVASTFYSYGRDPKEMDTLRLSVLAPKGEQVEAQCYDVDSHLSPSDR